MQVPIYCTWTPEAFPPSTAVAAVPLPTNAAGLAPGTTRSDAKGIAQVYVPAGCFMMGSSAAQQEAAFQTCVEVHGKDACPAASFVSDQRRVCITQSYWLDAYEVTNAAYQQFVEAGGYKTREYWSDAGWSWKGSRTVPNNCGSKSNGAQQPRVCVTWYEAEAYARWRGGRLPTEAEWEYAARGPQSLIYPWGDTFDASKVNAQDRLGKAAPVGSYESGKSWVGAYDMAGNVWEWVANWQSVSYSPGSDETDPLGPASGNRRLVCSSGWIASKDQTRVTNRYGTWPEASDIGIGFRVVSSSALPPSTGSMMPPSTTVLTPTPG